MNKSPITTRKAVAAAIVANSFWGLSFLAARVAMNSAQIILILSHRFLLAFFVMSLLLLTPLGDCHLRGKPLLPLLLLGILEPVVYFFGEQYGILHSSTVFSGVMIALIPIVSTLAAIPILCYHDDYPDSNSGYVLSILLYLLFPDMGMLIICERSFPPNYYISAFFSQKF